MDSFDALPADAEKVLALIRRHYPNATFEGPVRFSTVRDRPEYWVRGADVPDGECVICVTYLARLEEESVLQLRSRRHPDGFFDTLPPEKPAR